MQKKRRLPVFVGFLFKQASSNPAIVRSSMELLKIPLTYFKRGGKKIKSDRKFNPSINTSKFKQRLKIYTPAGCREWGQIQSQLKHQLKTHHHFFITKTQTQ